MTKWINTEIVSDSLFDPFLLGGEIPPSFLLQKYWQNIGNLYKIGVKTVIKRAEKGEKTRINTNISGIFKIPPSPPFITNEAEMLLFLYLLRGFSPFSEHIQKGYWQNIGKMLK